METLFGKRRSFHRRAATSALDFRAQASGSRAVAHPHRNLRLLIVLPLGLAFGLAQGCAALGVAFLSSAATTATKSGVSYTVDNRAQKTFTAPTEQVKASLLAALGEMALPIETDEKTDEGRRIVARTEGREVEIDLEAVTPKATKVQVVVREGWFWRDRATAEEIIEQTGRGVDAAVMAIKYGPGSLAWSFPKPPPGDGARALAASALPPWNPQRWREGFERETPPAPVVNGSAAIQPAVAKVTPAVQPAAVNGSATVQPAVAEAPSPAQAPSPPTAPPPVALTMVALGGGRAPGGEGVRPAEGEGRPGPSSLAMADPRPRADAESHAAEDNRWRVLRNQRLRECLEASCDWGATLRRGDVVVRLRENGPWWRVWLAGTDAVGWVPASDLAPQRWWDPAGGPDTTSAR